MAGRPLTGDAAVPVTFFLSGEADLAALARLDLERDWREYVRGERAWVLQTYLRLSRRGYPATLADRLPEQGLVVFHAKQKKAVARLYRRRPGLFLLAVRADNRAPTIADLEVVQNGCYHDGRHRFWVPFWPQAGLVPRDEERGSTIRQAAFKGFAANLHSELQTAEWAEFLRAEGIGWEEDMVPFAGSRTEDARLAWNDYSQVDLIVAWRPSDPKLYTSKPATKLYNAWQAGVPALLGPEYAYRELRRTPFDYLEICSLDDAKAAVRRLKADPDLYRVMVANGRKRAQEFSFDALTERWAELLYDTLPPLLPAVERQPLRRLPLGPRSLVRRLLRFLSRRPAI